MVANFKSNRQAELCKGTEISDSASEDDQLLESLSFDRYNANAQASEDDRQLRSQPVDIKEIFPGMASIQARAKKVQCQIKLFFRRTLESIIEIGNYLKEIESEVKSFFGSKEGEARFLQWLESPSGVGSPEVALSMMDITSWYNDLRPEMQRLIINKTWSFSVLKKLRGLSNELIKQLIKEEKQTLQSIERAIATSLADELTPLPAEEGSRPVTPSDWSSLRERFNLRPRHIKVLKQKAASLASLEAEAAPVVKVSHVNEAIAQCKEAPELLTQPAKKAKKNKIDTSTPAESPLQDNSDEAITELISGAIAGDMEKEQAAAHVSDEALTELVASAIAGDIEKKQAANEEVIALLQQTIAEKDATIATQKEQMTRAIAAELEKAAITHQSEMESLCQTLAMSSEAAGMYTQEEMEEALAQEREKRKDYVYTYEDLEEEVAYAREQVKSKMYTEEQMKAIVAEARAEVISTADTPDAEKLASYERALAEKDRTIASLEKQKADEIAQAQVYSEKHQAAAAVAMACANESERRIRELYGELDLLQQKYKEKNWEIARLSELLEAADAEKIASLEKKLAEREDAIASLEELQAAAVAEARALMEKEREAVVAQARADEREKMASAMAEKIASLENKLAERDDAIASYEEEKATAVAEARADEQAVACADIEMLQGEIDSLRAQNNSLMAARGQLVTATSQVEELKSQLAETEVKYSEKVRWLEADINRFVQSNQKNGEMMKMLEEANKSMHHENRSLKEELAGYKKTENLIRSKYSKLAKAENLEQENKRLRENLQGQTDQSVLLASRVNELSRALDEVTCMQRTLAKKEIPGCFEEYYVSPLDGQTYQGIKGLVKFLQDLVNNNFPLATA